MYLTTTGGKQEEVEASDGYQPFPQGIFSLKCSSHALKHKQALMVTPIE